MERVLLLLFFSVYRVSSEGSKEGDARSNPVSHDQQLPFHTRGSCDGYLYRMMMTTLEM